jgi:hypothetical protein
LPVFTNREVTHEIRLSEGETNVVGGLITDTDSTVTSGIPGLSQLPLLGSLFSSETRRRDQTEIIILLTPHIVKMPDLDEDNLRGLYVGTETNSRVLGIAGRSDDAGEPVGTAPAPESIAEPPLVPQPGASRLRFDRPTVSLAEGISVPIGILVETTNMTRLDFTLEFDASHVRLGQVSDGGFLSQDGVSVAVIQNVDTELGSALISVERPAVAGPIAGTGQVLSLNVENLRPGSSTIRVRNIQFRSTDGSPRSAPPMEIQVTSP